MGEYDLIIALGLLIFYFMITIFQKNNEIKRLKSVLKCVKVATGEGGEK